MDKNLKYVDHWRSFNLVFEPLVGTAKQWFPNVLGSWHPTPFFQFGRMLPSWIFQNLARAKVEPPKSHEILQDPRQQQVGKWVGGSTKNIPLCPCECAGMYQNVTMHTLGVPALELCITFLDAALPERGPPGLPTRERKSPLLGSGPASPSTPHVQSGMVQGAKPSLPRSFIRFIPRLSPAKRDSRRLITKINRMKI